MIIHSGILPRSVAYTPSSIFLHNRAIPGIAPNCFGSRKVTKRSQSGVAVVEFALVLPVLLLLVFGIIEFGLATYDKAVITNASREAARAGVVLRNPKLTTSQIQNVALNYCNNYLITLGSAATPTVTVPSGQGGNFGTPLTVTVSYNYSGLALGALISPLTGPLSLSATTVMNNE